MTGLMKVGAFSLAALFALPATAAELLPGGAVTAVGAARPGGLSLLDSRSESFTTFTGAGTLTSRVYSNDSSNPFGLDKLTFTYQLANGDDDGVPSEFFQLAVASFAGFQTDVSFDASVLSIGTVTPTFVQRGAGPGEQVVFSFLNPPVGGGAIGPGLSSAILVVQTDALGYANTISSIGGALAPNLDTLAPIAVPEPAGLGMLAVAAVFMRRSRRRHETR